MGDIREDIGPNPLTEDQEVEITLRPRRFEEFIGQERIKDNLRVYIQAAKQRREALDHVLFYGPPGLGKTTLANIISNELGVNIRSTSGPILERPGDLAAILTNLNEYDILFIDEIHRMPRVVEEVLYPALEDFHLDIIIGQGPSARTLKVSLPPFTLVGATTRTGLLTSPLRDRFGVIVRLQYYKPEDLMQIVKRSSGILGVEIEDDACYEIARRSRGTPRIANRLLRRVRDFAEVKGDGRVTLPITEHALEMMEVDHLGLDDMDRRLLRTIIEKYNGGPVGIETLAASLREDRETIEDVYEPFLLQEGLIERTPRGRLATRGAYEHLKIKIPQKLF
ncbi:MAG: Holliday junction branch migration DNA helicase RuvB [Nitrospirae bacterium]|nr:MAG: Holliday junction branch migration DNA helicase RuvB [Nitrospirota bacterium]